VLERLPEEHRPVLTRARDACLNVATREGERWDDLQLQVRRYGEHVVGEIKRLDASTTPG